MGMKRVMGLQQSGRDEYREECGVGDMFSPSYPSFDHASWVQ